jgi:hypothetical protein
MPKLAITSITPRSDNPWDWVSLESVDISMLASISDIEDSQSPLDQFLAVQDCLALRPEIESNSEAAGHAVLKAVQLCGLRGLVMPDWLFDAFNRRFHAVVRAQVKSWDDPSAFGVVWPDGTHLKVKRERPILRFRVRRAIESAINAEYEIAAFEPQQGVCLVGLRLKEKKRTPLDALYEKVDEQLGMKWREVKELYQEGIPIFGRLNREMIGGLKVLNSKKEKVKPEKTKN